MTVNQLIENLKIYPDDLMVIVSGYEGGVDEVCSLEKARIKLNCNRKEYLGDHEIIEDINKDWDVEALIISQ